MKPINIVKLDSQRLNYDNVVIILGINNSSTTNRISGAL